MTGALALESAPPRYWLGVVSRNHVERGVQGGFMQLCHGRAAPLARIRPGDGIVYYSPRTGMNAGVRLQAFTALGKVRPGVVYQHDMSEGFVPHRRDVDYAHVRPVPLAALAGELHFTQQLSWGVALRRGVLELDAHDFGVIARAMGV